MRFLNFLLLLLVVSFPSSSFAINPSELVGTWELTSYKRDGEIIPIIEGGSSWLLVVEFDNDSKFHSKMREVRHVTYMKAETKERYGGYKTKETEFDGTYLVNENTIEIKYKLTKGFDGDRVAGKIFGTINKELDEYTSHIKHKYSNGSLILNTPGNGSSFGFKKIPTKSK